MFENNITHYLKKHGFEAFLPKAVLFDMDGVLYNSMPHHAIAWQQSMQSFGIHMTEQDAYATEGMKGIDTIRQMVRQQKGIDISEDEAQKMYDEKSRLFHLMPQTPIFEGVFDLMNKIKAGGLQIGIVTGSAQKPLIQRLIDDFHDYVDSQHIVTAYNIKHGKPAPDPYLKGLQLTGNLQPWQAIVVENAPMGVRSGVAAQCFTVTINSGPLADSVLTDEGANLLFHNIPDFSNVWEQLMADAKHT